MPPTRLPVSRRSFLLAGLTAAAGCRGGSSDTPADTPTTATKAAKGDPWSAAAADLRRQTDAGTCRRVLTDLSAALSEANTPLPATAPDTADRLRLDPKEERGELLAGRFTPFDAAHLAECFYLRDAVRSLDVAGQPPEIQATVLFDWVCRQLYPAEWRIPVSATEYNIGPPLPPSLALGRGFGNGLERAYIFLQAARQLGLDAGLVGKPGQEQTPSYDQTGQPPAAALWAVGVKVGSDLLLFEPHRGELFPAGATLKKLKADPSPLKPWFEDKARPWPVTADDVKAATVYVAAPFPAATARAKRFDERLTGEVGVRMSADLPALAAALEPTAGGPVAVWAPPPTDAFCLTRGLYRSLPPDEGGADRSPAAQQIGNLLKRSAIPVALFAPPADLAGPGRQAIEPLFGRFAVELAIAFLEPRLQEKIHRGQLNEVISHAVKQEDRFAAAQQRARTDPAQADLVRKWCAEANQVYGRLSTARLPENRGQLPTAEAEVAEFWRSAAGGQAVLDQALAAAGLAEAVYVLAVCKHEQAERAEARKGRSADGPARAKTAWAAAADAWNRYAGYRELQDKAYPGRAAHAGRLTARAVKLAG